MVVKCPELHHLSDNLKQTRENRHVPVRAVPRVPLRPVQVRRIRKVKDRTTSVNEMIKTKIRNRSLVSLCYSSLLKWKFEDENSLEINYIDINKNICFFFHFQAESCQIQRTRCVVNHLLNVRRRNLKARRRGISNQMKRLRLRKVSFAL